MLVLNAPVAHDTISLCCAAFRFLLLFYIYIFEWTKLRAFMLIYTNICANLCCCDYCKFDWFIDAAYLIDLLQAAVLAATAVTTPVEWTIY